MQLRGISVVLVALLFAAPFAQTSSQKIRYISPAPGSKAVSREANIIIRPGRVVNGAALPTDPVLEVIGSKSGRHSGNLLLLEDSKTLVYKPRTPFVPGETVTVNLEPGFPGIPEGRGNWFSFRFTVAPKGHKLQVAPFRIIDRPEEVPEPTHPS